jgi:hypothetical protein
MTLKESSRSFTAIGRASYRPTLRAEGEAIQSGGWIARSRRSLAMTIVLPVAASESSQRSSRPVGAAFRLLL